MHRTMCPTIAFAVACALSLQADDALAFRMIQTTYQGRTTSGARVTCDAAGGFVHWRKTSLSWRLNPAGPGGGAGVMPAIQSAMAHWSQASPAGHVITCDGTTNAGFATDGINTILWSSGTGCSGGCLALTALVLGPGQEIVEADISFNPEASWSTGGADTDVEAIAAHELGHALGIHHTDVTRKQNRPTMYTDYFGIDGRTLEQDDLDALQCSCQRYPPEPATTSVPLGGPAQDHAHLWLSSRPRPGRTLLRFGLDADMQVRLDIFDLAGRRLATLVDGVRGAGEHEVAWDGTGPAGHLGSGVYFARIVAAGESASATAVLTR